MPVCCTVAQHPSKAHAPFTSIVWLSRPRRLLVWLPACGALISSSASAGARAHGHVATACIAACERGGPFSLFRAQACARQLRKCGERVLRKSTYATD